MNIATMAARYAEVRKRLRGEPQQRVNVYRPPEPIAEPEPAAEPETTIELLPGGARWREIVNEVAIARGMNASIILRGRRTELTCDARFECWYRMRTEIVIAGDPVSYPQIGKWFGKDHTTVLHGAKKWARINGLEMPR